MCSPAVVTFIWPAADIITPANPMADMKKVSAPKTHLLTAPEICLAGWRSVWMSADSVVKLLSAVAGPRIIFVMLT